ncbi:MAG: site-specific integrase [Fibromonadales bacterium]|nr:site-specific integrase [Fibromonadales bacterium]
MKFEDIQKMLKGSNYMRKMKLYARKTTGDNVVIWVYNNYERKSFDFPPFKLTSQAPKADEIAALKRIIARRDDIEAQGGGGFSDKRRKEKISKVMEEWINHYTVRCTIYNVRATVKKFLEINGDISVGAMTRQHIVKVMDYIKQEKRNPNYARDMASRLRSFCNWAEQRGYMDRVDTRNLLPPQTFGEVKILAEDEIKRLAAAPCDVPDVKDLFMLGIYTAQRTGEIANYTFALLQSKQIRARQGKTGKFIVIPLSEGAIAIIEGLRRRRIEEGKGTGATDKIFNLPGPKIIYAVFDAWLMAAGIPKGKVTLRNSRSTAISLLINKGVPISVTQELANHSNPGTTARYYRQIDDSKKKEALALIPVF